MRKITRIALIISGLSFVLWQSSLCQNPNFWSYGDTYGLGRPSVSAIYQDSRGILWVGTSGAGLYKFVQGRFSQVAVTPEVSGYDIRQLEEDAAGYLYILSESGLLRYDGRYIRQISDRVDNISCFAISQAGIWWSTVDTLFLHKSSGNIVKKGIAADILVPGYPPAHGMLVVNHDLLTVYDSLFNATKTISINSQQGARWVSYTRDADGSTWIVSDSGGLLHLDGAVLTTVQTDINDIHAVATGALGALWIGGEHGVSIYQTQDSSVLPIDIPSLVNCLYFDRQNRLWIGSDTAGMIRYFGEQHRVWNVPKYVHLQTLISGPTTDDVSLFTRAGKFLRLGDMSVQMVAPVDDPSARIYKDQLSRIWTLTADALWLRSDTSWILMDTSDNINGKSIVGSDRLGNIWMAGTTSLVRYGMKPVSFPTGVKFISENVRGNLPGDKTIAVLTDLTGNVWRVGRSSIGKILRDQYSQTHHLGFNVICAELDSSRVMWFGTEAAGIFRMSTEEGQVPLPLKTKYPLRVSDVVFVRPIKNGLIAGTDRNVLRFQTDTSGLGVTKVDVLNEETGVVLSHLGRDQFAVTEDGQLLVAAGDRIVEIGMARNDVVDNTPTVFLNQVLINGTDIHDTGYRGSIGPFYSLLHPLTLKWSENNVSFSVTGNALEYQLLRYQWRLLGLNPEWTESSADNEMQFATLPPGKYSLEVRVCDASGNCAGMREPWRFAVKKALWHHLWFWLAMGLLVLGGLWLWYQWKNSLKKREDERERKRLEAELNALTLEQKSLQLQMNPHFIFNALQTVKSHIQEDNLDDARQNLTQFAKLMRTMLEMSRQEKITLEDELEFLQAYVDVEKLCHRLPVVFTMEVDASVEPYEIKLPPMLIQPVLENAIKYGGDGNEIQVALKMQHRHGLLTVSIEDNGPGFGSHAPKHESASFEIIKSRLIHLGKTGGLEINQSKGGGAIVILKIPDQTAH